MLENLLIEQVQATEMLFYTSMLRIPLAESVIFSEHGNKKETYRIESERHN